MTSARPRLCSRTCYRSRPATATRHSTSARRSAKEKTLHAFVAQVEGLAARQPVLIVFEDVHWSDPSSRDLFDLIVDRVSTLPVLVIITFRPEFAPPWVGRAHVTLLSLNRLRPPERAAMISCVTGGKALPEEVTEQIIDRTDGVPLFIEELTKAVVESGVLVDAGDRWTMAGPLPPFAIPTSLARLAAGAARSPGAGARGGADRSGAGPSILA